MRIYKNINKNNQLIFTKKFPCQKITISSKKHKAMLGIGGNVGDVVRRFEHLFTYLNRSIFLNILETSPILKNPPFGYLEQNDFHNSLLLVETNLTPRELLSFVLHTEKIFGRKRSFENAPRTLDIDIIFYDDIEINSKTLTIPHPQWSKRDSVLVPLSYMKGRVW